MYTRSVRDIAEDKTRRTNYMKAETIILGNVTTMDEFKPYAEAIAVADEKIIYVGSRDAAMKLKDDKTRILDYRKGKGC